MIKIARRNLYWTLELSCSNINKRSWKWVSMFTKCLLSLPYLDQINNLPCNLPGPDFLDSADDGGRFTPTCCLKTLLLCFLSNKLGFVSTNLTSKCKLSKYATKLVIHMTQTFNNRGLIEFIFRLVCNYHYNVIFWMDTLIIHN